MTDNQIEALFLFFMCGGIMFIATNPFRWL